MRQKLTLAVGMCLTGLAQPVLARRMYTAARVVTFKQFFLVLVIITALVYFSGVRKQRQIEEREAEKMAEREEWRHTSLVVVDAQNDFIEGSLAVQNGMEATEAIVDFMNKHPEMHVFYTADCHSPQNQSFKENGGIWPVHCVEGTEGAEIHPAFTTVENPEQRPSEKNIYHKGKDDVIEEYSGFAAQAENGDYLHEVIRSDVVLCGFASEFCVKETALTLVEAGYDVRLLADGVGYVDHDNHIETILDLEKNGITLI